MITTWSTFIDLTNGPLTLAPRGCCGFRSVELTGPNTPPVWKCLVVDLLDEDLVVEEDPNTCNIVFYLPKPEFRLSVLRSCVIYKHSPEMAVSVSVQLRSTYH